MTNVKSYTCIFIIKTQKKTIKQSERDIIPDMEIIIA